MCGNTFACNQSRCGIVIARCALACSCTLPVCECCVECALCMGVEFWPECCDCFGLPYCQSAIANNTIRNQVAKSSSNLNVVHNSAKLDKTNKPDFCGGIGHESKWIGVHFNFPCTCPVYAEISGNSSSFLVRIEQNDEPCECSNNCECLHVPRIAYAVECHNSQLTGSAGFTGVITPTFFTLDWPVGRGDGHYDFHIINKALVNIGAPPPPTLPPGDACCNTFIIGGCDCVICCPLGHAAMCDRPHNFCVCYCVA